MFSSKKENNEEVDNFTRPWVKYYDGNFEHVDYFDGSLYEKILDTSSRFPNNYALEYFNKKYTYKQMINEIDKVAISLNKLGIKENDYVTICMVNCPEAIFTFYAINKIGFKPESHQRHWISKFANFKVGKPPIELQNQFADFVKHIDKLKFTIKQSIEKLELCYKSLMKQYFD